MYLPEDAPRNRIREAQKARDNRAEVVKARSHGQITRRDLFRWGLFTTSGMLLYKNGFSPYAPSAYAQVPTGTPRSPLFGIKKFTQPMQRLDLQKPISLTRDTVTNYAKWGSGEFDARASPFTPNTRQTPPTFSTRTPLLDGVPATAGRPDQSSLTSAGPNIIPSLGT